MELTETLRRLRLEDPELAQVMDFYGEADRIYHAALSAMRGEAQRHTRESRSSAEVTLAIGRHDLSSTDEWRAS